MTILTQNTLKSLLTYNFETGWFRWNQRRGSKRAGSLAGSLHSKGYVHISLCRRLYKAHRLAWLYVYGTMPEDEIDHINGIKNDNRICNLRIVTHGQNMQNTRRVDKGVTFSKGYWRARITHDKSQIFLGRFKDKADALAARKAAELKYHTHRISNAGADLLSGRRTEADGDLVVVAGQE